MLRSRPGVKKKVLTEAEIGRLIQAYRFSEQTTKEIARRFGVTDKDVTAYADAAGVAIRSGTGRATKKRA